MSLRLRLLLAAGVVTLVALAVADVATYSALRDYLIAQVDNQLEASHANIEHYLDQGGYLAGCSTAGTPGSGGEPGQGNGSGPGGTGTGQGQPAGSGSGEPPGTLLLDTFVEVRTPAGVVVDGQRCVPFVGGSREAPALPKVITGFVTQSNGERVTYQSVAGATSGAPSFRVRASKLEDGNELVLAEPLNATASTLRGLTEIELAVSLAALLAAAALGWWLVRVGLRPLADAERTAQAIAAGELDERVPGENQRSEIGRLARALNVMLERIQSAFAARDATEARLRASEARLRRFVADASHELRTPLAAVSAYAELFGRGAAQRPEDLERVLGGIRSETARMARLVDDLLVLARLDEGQTGEQHPVELVSLCAEAVHAATALGPAWTVRLEAAEPVEVAGDGQRLRQVVDNLLGNVRAHTPAGTNTVVSVTAAGGEAVVTVADDGPGVTGEDVSHLFERFWRADTSRARTGRDGASAGGGSVGGSGLGLAIVSAIVAAHGGSVSASTSGSASASVGPGLSVVVRLPRLHPSPGPDGPDGSWDERDAGWQAGE